MEWVEKTGKTVEEAKERALEQLGVAAQDAEFVVLAEAKTGLFGRMRSEARVRARVRPAEPRPKRQRRQKERRPGGERAERPDRPERERGGSRRQGAGSDTEPSDAGNGRGRSQGDRPAATTGGTVSTTSSASRRRRRRGGSGRQRSGADAGDGGQGGNGAASAAERHTQNGDGRHDNGAAKEETTVADEITLEEQAAVAKEFLEGLIERYGLKATVDVRELDPETVELSAKGDGLGVLVGPKGATLSALQDVTRTVVQKHFPNKTDRIMVDVAGYRERRVAALQRFTAEVAAEVVESGIERALEPMSAADRKVVHDAAAEIDGVVTSSQGEDPYRFVVVSPAS